MKREVTVKIILAAVFLLIAYASVARFAAEIQFGRSEFDKAISIDPFDARYLAGSGSFLLEEARHEKNQAPFLENARALYLRAAKLDPQNAQYHLVLGQIEMRLGEDIDKALRFFGLAHKNDPKGINVSYSIGYSAIPAWDKLDEEQKKFILERLKYTLEARPEYSKYIYPALWQKAKDFRLFAQITAKDAASKRNLYAFMAQNNLWQFRKGIADAVDFSVPKEALHAHKRSGGITRYAQKEEWRGSSSDGRYGISDGLMYWNGVIHLPVMMQAGRARISLEAKKVMAIPTDDASNPRFFPYMIVRLDEEDIGEAFVSGDEWEEYEFSVDTSAGPKLLSVEFVNDIYDPGKGLDRNLAIGDVKISYEERAGAP